MSSISHVPLVSSLQAAARIGGALMEKAGPMLAAPTTLNAPALAAFMLRLMGRWGLGDWLACVGMGMGMGMKVAEVCTWTS